MIEIQNLNALNKGTLLATCDVRIVPWKMILRQVKIFEKGSNRWLGLPSREYSDDMGTKKYIEMIGFDNDTLKNRFRDQVMEAIDKHFKDNPDMKPDDAIKETDQFPF